MDKLTALHPEIERLFFETYSKKNSSDESRILKTKQVMGYIEKLVEITSPKHIAVVGCGPAPSTIKALETMGHKAVGIEPEQEYVESANDYLSGCGRVAIGQCESMRVADESFDIIFCESVLEHVDSPEKSMDEFYRVLKPGGIVYIVTENNLRFSLTGRNNEFNKRYYNWYPRSVKEGYIKLHLNKKPWLANYTPLPAVHWYTFASLCRLGRYAGFGKFYSILDVIDENDPRVKKLIGGKIVLRWIKNNPWLRALMLRQVGTTIFMYKRK